MNGQTVGPGEGNWSDAAMHCRDGVRLAARIWKPGGKGPWPVLLMRQPYGRAIASTVTYAHPSWYAGHGFLVVVQDVRGRGDSGGDFRGFAQEAADGADSIRWARCLEGSNGRLGCYGFSYQGLTQLLNDASAGRGEGSEALPDCLAPAMAGLDERTHWASEGGAHWWAVGLAWGLQLAAQRCQRQGDTTGWRAIRRSLGSGAFLEEGLQLLEQHDPTGMALGWLHAAADRAADWPQHQPDPELLRRPMLLIGGWHDPHLRGILDLWQRGRAAGGAPLLRIGAWSHLDWGAGIDRLQLAFFQHHLQGHPPAAELADAVLLEDALSHHWQAPGSDAPAPAWGLASGGLAASDAEEGQLLAAQGGRGGVTIVHDPWRPVPGRGGHLGLDAGGCDRQDIDRRGDVACFTTSRLAEPLHLDGRPRLRVRVQADRLSFDLCAALSRLPAGGDGRVQQLSTGVARFTGSAGETGARESAARELWLQPLRACLNPGDQLRLSLAGAAWPHIAVNPGDGSPAGPIGPDHRPISLAFDLNGAELRLLPLLHGEVGAN